MFFRIVLMWLTMFTAQYTLAAIDVQEFTNEEQRAQYQKLIEELRCPKCKNQNLEGTNSAIAIDLRNQLHDMILEGQTEEQIIDFMVSRYGDFVLYRPRVQSNTLLLWFGPGIMALIALITLATIIIKRSRAPQSVSLSDEEQARLDDLMVKLDDSGAGHAKPDAKKSNTKEFKGDRSKK